MRGQLKETACMLVHSNYGLTDKKSRARRTRKQYLRLLEDDAYLHEVRLSLSSLSDTNCCLYIRTQIRRGHAGSTQFSWRLCTVFFAKHNAEGLREQEYFNPIPATLVALTAAAVSGSSFTCVLFFNLHLFCLGGPWCP